MAVRPGIAASVVLISLQVALPVRAAELDPPRETPADPTTPLTPPSLLVPTTLTASQDAGAAYKAIDGLDGTAWCARGGESLTLTFASATDMDQLEVRAGVWKLGEGGKQEVRDAPKDLQIASDTGEILVMHPGKAGHVMMPWTGKAPKTLVIKPGPMPSGKLACLDGVIAWREGAALRMVTGVDGAALEKLPADLKSLQSTLQTCDKPALAKAIRLPMTVAGQKVAALPKAVALCKTGKLAVPAFVADDVAREGVPVAPAELSVPLPAGTWHLAWQQGTWKLAGVQAGQPHAQK